jgi:hypothetical protein
MFNGMPFCHACEAKEKSTTKARFNAKKALLSRHRPAHLKHKTNPIRPTELVTADADN